MSIDEIVLSRSNDPAGMKISDQIKLQQLAQLEWLIQTDLGCRGIHRIPEDNLCTRTQGHLAKAIQFLIEHPGNEVGIATGFFIPNAQPPAPENDGPPGALFLARGLNRLGYPVLLISDRYGIPLLEQGVQLFADHLDQCDLVEFPMQISPFTDMAEKGILHPNAKATEDEVRNFFSNYDKLGCLFAIERVGPSHTVESFSKQGDLSDQSYFNWFLSHGPGELQGEPFTMNGLPVGQHTAPLHLLFENRAIASKPIFTIGIGDGGNEIGMGSIPWHVIASNIASEHSGKFACRVAADATIVAGVSNWAAYALIAGLYLCLNRVDELLQLFDVAAETKLIECYFQTGIAVDGKLGHPAMSVDGIPWELHVKLFELIKAIVAYYH